MNCIASFKQYSFLAFDSLVELSIILTNVVLKFHDFSLLSFTKTYYVLRLHFYFTDICLVRDVSVVLLRRRVYSWTDRSTDNSDNMGYYEWMSKLNKNRWKTIAEHVLLWNLLNCIGSIYYGKHIPIFVLRNFRIEVPVISIILIIKTIILLYYWDVVILMVFLQW